MMSKQLALSIAASVLAMAGFALFGNHAATTSLADSGARWSIQADSSVLPDLGQLMPTLQ